MPGLISTTPHAPGTNGGYHDPAHYEILAAAGTNEPDELTYNTVALQLTRQVIADDPIRALYIMFVLKPALYLGSDNVLAQLEAYQEIWPDSPTFPKALKATLLLMCNTYYNDHHALPSAFGPTNYQMSPPTPGHSIHVHDLLLRLHNPHTVSGPG